VATVSAGVKNTGSVKGAEVTQLYVGIPGGPVRQLRGFDKQVLEPEQSYTATFTLTRSDLSIWDVTAQKWMLQKAAYQIFVGDSSRNLPLTGSLTL
jgi:beta-glucosidase